VVRDHKRDTHSRLRLLSSMFRIYTHSEPRFLALLTDEGSREIHRSILELILCKDQPRNTTRPAS
jgi:hypothetical protein